MNGGYIQVLGCGNIACNNKFVWKQGRKLFAKQFLHLPNIVCLLKIRFWQGRRFWQGNFIPPPNKLPAKYLTMDRFETYNKRKRKREPAKACKNFQIPCSLFLEYYFCYNLYQNLKPILVNKIVEPLSNFICHFKPQETWKCQLPKIRQP